MFWAKGIIKILYCLFWIFRKLFQQTKLLSGTKNNNTYSRNDRRLDKTYGKGEKLVGIWATTTAKHKSSPAEKSVIGACREFPWRTLNPRLMLLLLLRRKPGSLYVYIRYVRESLICRSQCGDRWTRFHCCWRAFIFCFFFATFALCSGTDTWFKYHWSNLTKLREFLVVIFFSSKVFRCQRTVIFFSQNKDFKKRFYLKNSYQYVVILRLHIASMNF